MKSPKSIERPTYRNRGIRKGSYVRDSSVGDRVTRWTISRTNFKSAFSLLWEVITGRDYNPITEEYLEIKRIPTLRLAWKDFSYAVRLWVKGPIR